jgi:hypothetical protein
VRRLLTAALCSTLAVGTLAGPALAEELRGSADSWTWASPEHDRLNPCETIEFLVNEGGHPGFSDDVREALWRVGQASGHVFRYQGTTDFVQTRSRLVPVGTDLVVSLLSPDQTDVWGGSGHAAGLATRVVTGGYVAGGAAAPRVARASIVIQPHLGPGFEPGLTTSRGEVVMHEGAHVVGLGHVNDETQLMNPASTGLGGTFGAGDLAGLAAIGARAGCLYTTREEAVANKGVVPPQPSSALVDVPAVGPPNPGTTILPVPVPVPVPVPAPTPTGTAAPAPAPTTAPGGAPTCHTRAPDGTMTPVPCPSGMPTAPPPGGTCATRNPDGTMTPIPCPPTSAPIPVAGGNGTCFTIDAQGIRRAIDCPPESSTGPAPAPAPATGTSAAPTLTLAPGTISAGESTTVTYRGAPGATVDILSRTQPSTVFTKIGTVVLDGAGIGRSTHKPQKNTRITARSAEGSMSATAPVLAVRSVASFNAQRVAPRTWAFTGRVYPALANRLVNVYRDGALVAQGRCDTTGAYRITKTLVAGTFDFQVRTANDQDNLGTASRVLRLGIS